MKGVGIKTPNRHLGRLNPGDWQSFHYVMSDDESKEDAFFKATTEILAKLWGPRAEGFMLGKKYLAPTPQETLLFTQRNMATLWKHLYKQPENVPRELITSVMKCSCKESSNGLFCSRGTCKCSKKSDNSGCNFMCKCQGGENCFLKQQQIVDSVQNISLDEISQSPTKRVRIMSLTDESSEDLETTNGSDCEPDSSSSDETLIHMPTVFSSRRLTIQQKRRLMPTDLEIPVIETSNEINISHFVPVPSSMELLFMLPISVFSCVVAMAILDLPAENSVVQEISSEEVGTPKKYPNNGYHRQDYNYDDSCESDDLDVHD